jgi:hypothetical protein
VVWIDLEKPADRDGASEPLPIDGCLLLGTDAPSPELLAAFGRVTRVASAERVVAALPEILPRMRALGAARAALASVRAAEAALDELELGADVLGQHRLDELAGLRLDPAAHADAVLRAQAEGARGRVRGALELAVEKVSGELDRLAALWLAELEPARDREALARCAASLREASAAALGKLARGVRDRLLQAVTTGAHDLAEEAAAELNGRLATLATTAGDAPTPGGSPDFRRRRLADPETLEPARRALVVPDPDPDDEAPALTPSLSGRRAAKLFGGADGGLFGRFRDPESLRASAMAATRERLQALREAALADLQAAEGVLTSRLTELVRRFVTEGARAFTAAADALVAAETAGLEADLAHLRATLVSVRMELACRAPPLTAAVDRLVAEIDALV